MASIRVFSLVLLGFLPTCAFCSPQLPDAPGVVVEHTSTFNAFAATDRLSVDTVSAATLQMKYDPLHLQDEGLPRRAGTSLFVLPTPSKRAPISESSGLFSRAINAASGVVLSRDGDGTRRLNKQYLLRLAVVATAHAGETPFWRRSPSQPLSDFGSMVGNDAGMHVFHVFQPGIVQLVKNREPRFVTRFQQHKSN